MSQQSESFRPLFLGHGSPMNAMADNSYTRFLRDLGKSLSTPEAIIVLSAHWQSKGTSITSGAFPEQIYDFYGFPEDLYQILYRAPGSPKSGRKIARIIPEIQLDDHRGIDHGSWTILKHLFPQANVPVLQISLDLNKTHQEHWDLGKKLAALRDRFLFIGSGNVIHNLREISFDDDAPPFTWAVESDLKLKQMIEGLQEKEIIHLQEHLPRYRQCLPTNEHFLPLLYVMAMRNENEKAFTLFEGIQNGSISMRSFAIQPLAA